MGKARPRIQRAFFRWLAGNKQRFVIPIRIIRRMDHQIEVHFVRLNPIISISLSNEVWVCVKWKNEIWDCLCNFEAVPLRVNNGYVCKLCNPEMREVFPNREALWRNHLFEPFLEWINTKLAQASYIGLYSTDGTGKGGTWAELIQGNLTLNEAQPQTVALHPLWQHISGDLTPSGKSGKNLKAELCDIGQPDPR